MILEDCRDVPEVTVPPAPKVGGLPKAGFGSSGRTNLGHHRITARTSQVTPHDSRLPGEQSGGRSGIRPGRYRNAFSTSTRPWTPVCREALSIAALWDGGNSQVPPAAANRLLIATPILRARHALGGQRSKTKEKDRHFLSEHESQFSRGKWEINRFRVGRAARPPCQPGTRSARDAGRDHRKATF